MQQESRESGASSSLSATSPSFNSYSSENIADIAARVLHELNLSHDDDLYDDYFYSSLEQNDAFHGADINGAVEVEAADNDAADKNDDDVEDEEESEFEFAVFSGEDTSSPISADEIFSNGQIKPIYYPVFNTDLIFGYQNSVVSDGSKTASDGNNTAASTANSAIVRLPLRKLMSEERESRGNGSVSSSSSSEDGELEGVPQGTYCVWAPGKKSTTNNEENTVALKKKSNSTGSGAGSSKRWRLKDLIHRSNSDGKDTFVFLTPAHHRLQNRNGGGEMKRREKVAAVNSNYYGGGKKRGGAAEDMKKKSYLPYRQDLVGFFSNVHGFSRTIRPF